MLGADEHKNGNGIMSAAKLSTHTSKHIDLTTKHKENEHFNRIAEEFSLDIDSILEHFFFSKRMPEKLAE